MKTIDVRKLRTSGAVPDDAVYLSTLRRVNDTPSDFEYREEDLYYLPGYKPEFLLVGSYGLRAGPSIDVEGRSPWLLTQQEAEQWWDQGQEWDTREGDKVWDKDIAFDSVFATLEEAITEACGDSLP